MFLTIYLLGLVSFLTDISSEMINAMMPAFLLALKSGGIAIGIVGNLPFVFQGITHFLSGTLSDKIGRRKPLIFAGYLFSSISKILIAFSNSIPLVAAARSGDRIGKGIRSAPRDSLIGDVIPKEFAGKAFGIHRMMDTTGAAFGTILAFVMWNLGFGIKSILLTASVIAFTALIPIIILKEKRRIKKEKQTNQTGNLASILFYIAVFSLGNLSYLFFVVFIQLSYKKAGATAVSAGIISYIIYNLFYAASAVPAGKYSDKTTCRKAMFVGNSLFLILCVYFVFVRNPYLLMASMVVFGVSHGFVDVNQRVWINSVSKAESKGKSMGLFQMVRTIFLLIGGIVQGILWNSNPALCFLWGGFWALAGLVVLIFHKQ
ncbi:MAG: MFS transporter [Elusimicrobia bacterium]|nr:MFS transporter [Elusimicrobiota bacterium]